MKYLSVSEAKGMDGLRLVLGVQSPGPWSLAARALFSLRNVPFVPVRQDLMMPNEDLVEWTGRRNAPVAVYNDEPAVDGWLEILNLAERLGSGPSLLPDDPVDRALAIGFSAEICGAGGFGWSRRIAMSAGGFRDDQANSVMRAYDVLPGNVPAAEQRLIGILTGLSKQLKRQAAAGSRYLVGNCLSACDVHWACFSQLVAPLGEDAIDIDPHLRTMFAAMPDDVQAALDVALVAHRDRIWQDHIGLPVDYLPD